MAERGKHPIYQLAKKLAEWPYIYVAAAATTADASFVG